MSVALLLFIVFLLLILVNVPIGLSLGIASLGYVFFNDLPFVILPHRIIGGVDSFPLLAIPFFLLAGNLMNNGGVTKRIFDFSAELVGHITGGLGHVNIVASVIFAGMTGSALADAAGLGTVEIKAMQDEGFDTPFSAAVTLASSTIGPIIPPSIPFVIYGVLAEVSIGRLFLGGVVPGLIMAVALMILVYIIASKRNYPKRKRTTLKRITVSFSRAFPCLLAPVFIIGTIVLGIVSPTEAGAIAIVYAIILGCFIYRELSYKDIIRALADTFETTAIIMFVVGCASLFGWILTCEQIAPYLSNLIASISVTPIVVLLAVNVLLLILGCFMETTSIMVILIPILAPTLSKIGVDLVHFGVIMTLNLMIGLLTPPFGMGLIVVSKIANITVAESLKATWPFLVPLLVTLLLITIYAPLVTWFPNWIMG